MSEKTKDSSEEQIKILNNYIEQLKKDINDIKNEKYILLCEAKIRLQFEYNASHDYVQFIIYDSVQTLDVRNLLKQEILKGGKVYYVDIYKTQVTFLIHDYYVINMIKESKYIENEKIIDLRKYC